MRTRPSGTARWIQLAAAVVLAVLAVTGAAAAHAHGAVPTASSAAALLDEDVATAADDVTIASHTTVTPAPDPADAGFTLGDLAAGRVPQPVRDRFWQAQLDAVVAAPCPDAPPAGGTTVTLYLGADEAWTARLSDAAAAHRAACAA